MISTSSGTILLLSASPIVEDLLAAEVEDYIPCHYDRIPDTAEPVLAQLSGLPRPDVIVLDGISDPTAALQFTADLTAADPLIMIILVADRTDLALSAIRAGVRDIVVPDAGSADLGAAIDRALRSRAVIPLPVPTTEQLRPAPSAGRIVTVVSPKGGVGKTTLATNIAVGLAQRFPGGTVLVDLDIQFGDVASALDLEPEYFLPDTVTGQARRDPMALKTILTEHRTGLYAVCAPDSPIDADSITGEDVGHLLRMLASEFRFVVVDTAPGLSEHTLSALDETTDLVLLSSMEVPGVRGLRKELDTLGQLDMLPEHRQVVINFADPHGLLSLADIEATIRTRVDHQLPRSKAAVDAVNQGVPLLENGTRDPLTKQLKALVNAITDSDDGTDAATVADDRTQSGKIKPRRAASRWSRTKQLVAR
jgi:pilus assembly protein CpaE